MKIAIIHYHLKTGGVTSVIRSHVACLRKSGHQVMVITGQDPDDFWPVPVVSVPEIAYDTVRRQAADPQAAAAEIMAAIEATWSQGCDLIHVHNPTLAKNRAFLQVLKLLQGRGQRLFLQIHDFAEDGRPDVFFKEDYPAHCHYGVINRRDYRLMLRAGLKPEGLHLVPNAVTPLPAARTERPLKEPFIVYPVRAIRRKNIGEALLISAFFPPAMKLAITQPPNSPADMVFYENWQNFASAWRLPVIFEAGNKYDFGALLAHCNLVLTTSITEGFGFVYLEPWTIGKAVWGRRLDEICSDFRLHGINLDHLYTGLQVPLELFDTQSFRRRRQQALMSARESFGLTCDLPADGFNAQMTAGWIDFGLLDEIAQQEVIVAVKSLAAARKKLLTKNPFLALEAFVCLPSDVIAANQAAVATNYVRMDLAAVLLAIYRKVVEKPVCQQIDKQVLLKSFLVPENFSLLKWSRPHGR